MLSGGVPTQAGTSMFLYVEVLRDVLKNWWSSGEYIF